MSASVHRNRDFRLGVRWKLSGPFILMAILVVAILLPLTNRVVSKRIQGEADRRLSEIGDSVAVLLEQSEREAELSASFVASLQELTAAGDNVEQIGAVLNARRAELDLQELSFYTPTYKAGQGAYYYAGPEITRPFQQGNATIRDNLIFQTLENGTVDSRIAIAPRASEIMGAAPVYGSNGELTGVIIAVYFLDDVFMQKMSDVVNADLALVRGHAVIASTLADTSAYENYIRAGFIDGIENQPYASRNIEDNDTPQRLLAKNLMIDGSMQGVIMIAQPIQSLFGIRQDINYIIGVFAMIIVVLAFLFATFSYFNFARPLGKLAEATRRISGGDFGEPIKVPNLFLRDELTDLSENFNLMTARLEASYNELERRVEERTHSLEERTRQLIEQQQRLNVALQELSEARDQALEANRIKSAFMANMSHELRTPLNAIIGYTNLVMGRTYGEINTTQEDRLKRVYDNGQHLLQLINDVLDLSKVEAGKMEVYLETFDLAGVLDNVLQTSAALMDKNQNKLVRAYTDDLGAMRSDVTKVRQVLFNLISNAAKFTEKGTVTLKVEEQSHADGTPGFLFQVIDSGIGMTPAQLDKLFQAFTQADSSTTRKYGGTGLGLAISKQFCEMLGGSVKVTSEINIGTTFAVWLPRESLEPGKLAEKKKIQTGTHSPIPANKSRVLVIDDDEASLEVMTHYLESHHFHVITTNNGEDGLRLAKEYLPNVIVMDVLMPGMDGWEVLSRLKNTPEVADIPVVMATIVNGREMGFALGAVDYITKPVEEGQFLRVVEKYRGDEKDCSVLLVEDDASTRQMMRDILETAGWQVKEAADGYYGLEALGQQLPRMILLDLMMPRMNGFEFIKEVRKHEQWRSIPVVVITAMDLKPEERAELEIVVQKVVQKGSYQQDDLLKEVRRLARAATPTPAPG